MVDKYTMETTALVCLQPTIDCCPDLLRCVDSQTDHQTPPTIWPWSYECSNAPRPLIGPSEIMWQNPIWEALPRSVSSLAGYVLDGRTPSAKWLVSPMESQVRYGRPHYKRWEVTWHSSDWKEIVNALIGKNKIQIDVYYNWNCVSKWYDYLDCNAGSMANVTMA